MYFFLLYSLLRLSFTLSSRRRGSFSRRDFGGFVAWWWWFAIQAAHSTVMRSGRLCVYWSACPSHGIDANHQTIPLATDFGMLPRMANAGTDYDVFFFFCQRWFQRTATNLRLFVWEAGKTWRKNYCYKNTSFSVSSFPSNQPVSGAQPRRERARGRLLERLTCPGRFSAALDLDRFESVVFFPVVRRAHNRESESNFPWDLPSSAKRSSKTERGFKAVTQILGDPKGENNATLVNLSWQWANIEWIWFRKKIL